MLCSSRVGVGAGESAIRCLRVLPVDREDAIVVLAHQFQRVAAAEVQVGGVRQQVDVARVGHAISLWISSGRSIGPQMCGCGLEPHAEIGRGLAERVQAVGQHLQVVVGGAARSAPAHVDLEVLAPKERVVVPHPGDVIVDRLLASGPGVMKSTGRPLTLPLLEMVMSVTP